MNISQKDLDKKIKEDLMDFFSSKGYGFFFEYHNSYFRKKNLIFLSQFEMQTSKFGIDYASHILSFVSVEEVILEIGMPTNSLASYKDDKHFLATVKNSDLNFSFNQYKPAKTENDCIMYFYEIMEYFETSGANFIEKYSHLPNVLAEMDNLGEDEWHKILGGMADHRFRGLIISKICNDVRFFQKKDFCDNKFYTLEILKPWIPYYENLKKRLDVLAPLY